MALEDQDLDNQDDDVAVRCCGFCNPNKGDFFNWPPPEFAKCWPVSN